MLPLITVIVPVYNVEKYILKCLESIASQTYSNYEAIIVNDGSTDTSGLIVKEFAKAHKNFRYIEQQNKGQASARNAGIRVAEGDYIAFVDGDDYIHENYLEKLLQLILNEKADISMCSAIRVWEDGREQANLATTAHNMIYTDIHSFLLEMGFSVWNKLYRKSLLEGISFPDGIKYEDFAWLPQVVLRANRIVSTDEPLYYYLWRTGSTLNSRRVNRDILKAFGVLEKSAVSERFPDVMIAFFIKIVMGTLIWGLLIEKKENVAEVRTILNDAKKRYPDLENRAVSFGKYMGKEKELFGRLLIAGHFETARLYAMGFDALKQTARVVKVRAR